MKLDTRPQERRSLAYERLQTLRQLYAFKRHRPGATIGELQELHQRVSRAWDWLLRWDALYHKQKGIQP